jgi:hypothetical protein
LLKQHQSFIFSGWKKLSAGKGPKARIPLSESSLIAGAIISISSFRLLRRLLREDLIPKQQF